MRGLPFPTNALFVPEPPSEHGTPASNQDDIPIDPALAAVSSIDPAIATDGNALPGASHQVSPSLAPTRDSQSTANASRVLHPLVVQDQFPPPLQKIYPQEPLPYDQGPQGDPFAPQPPAPYLPVPETELPRVPRPQRRKRKPRREEECGFCQGNDLKNKLGEPEPMVSCEECGRSGHPSCMELGKVSDVVRSYPWRCIECKICEICQEKGDDARILFCDFCDRGWHMDCLQPPLDEEPPGQWHCPLCPPFHFLPPHPDPTLAHNGAFAPAGLDQPGPESSTSDAGPRNGLSDTDSDETVNAPTARHPRSLKKKRPANRTLGTLTPRPSKRMRIKGKGKEREDDMEHNVFEDLLPPTERDTSKTNIDNNDRTRFEKSRLTAEEKLYPTTPFPPHSVAENPDTPIAGPSSRPLRSATLHQLSIPPSTSPISPVPSTPGFVPHTPGTFSQTPNTPIVADGQSTLRIRTIRFGPYDIHPWYDAPFPEEYANLPDGRLWICEFCLKYMRSRFAFGRHRMKCKARHPPGDEIHRDGAVSIFEVDGRKNKIYCQNLCLLSKMFLDHKSLFYDVEPFLFYVMTEIDDIGAHFVGYFSKEKCSPKQYNVSCIMTLPVRQRQGWGNYLIDFSYLLSKKEQRVGSPEKPLSGLGALGYKNYWTLALMRYLKSAPQWPTLEDISRATSMTIEDIYTILVQARHDYGQSIKFPRGRKNGIARRHLQRHNSQKQMEGGGNKPNAPFVVPTQYEIAWDQGKVDRWLEAWEKKGYLRLKPEKLKWTPFVLSRTKAGVEVLQTEAGLGFGVAGHNGPSRSSMDSGTPTDGQWRSGQVFGWFVKWADRAGGCS
ncbi:acyl-CoA N-acyltransferase [Chiua virens]|nr:acyl-CoA N-acyltransferase [Chiua virens]